MDCGRVILRVEKQERVVVRVEGLQGRPGKIITKGISADAAVVAGDDVWVDTSGGPVEVSLPATPELGTFVAIFREGIHPLIIDPSGGTIQGVSAPYVIGVDGEGARFRYLFGTWKVEVLAPPRKVGQPIGLLLAITRAI